MDRVALGLVLVIVLLLTGFVLLRLSANGQL